MAIQIRNWVLETEKRTNIQQTDRLLIGNAANGESLYTTVQDFANLMVGAGFINQGDWQTGTTYNPGDYVFAESVGGGGSSMYFLKGSSPYLSSIDPKDDLTHWSEFAGIPGPQGPKGDKGDTGAAFTYEDFTPEQLDALVGPAGDSGWSPLERTVVDNTNLDSEGQYRVVREVYDWIGGEGTKPTLTGYIGASGIVANIVNAENIRGSRGATGATGAKGDQGDQGIQGEQGIQGIQGEKGDKGDKGETGPMGEGLHFDATGPISGRGTYDSEPAGFVYLADDESKFYVRLDPTGWSAGQSIAGGLQTLSQPAIGQIAISSGNTINLNTVNMSGNQTGIAGNKTWTGAHTFSLLSGTGNGIVGVTSTGQLTRTNVADFGYVPYTGATSGVDLNTQSFSLGGEFNRGENVFDQRILFPGTTAAHFRKLRDVASLSRSSSSLEGDIIITLPILTTTRWVMKLDIQSISGSGYNVFTTVYISAYGPSNTTRSVYGLGGIDQLSQMKFGRIGNNSVVILKSSVNRVFSYGKVVISEFYHGTTYDSALSVKENYKIEFIKEEDLVGFTLNGTVTNAQFTRDPYYLDYNNFVNTPSPQTLSLGSTAGNIAISGGNSVSLNSIINSTVASFGGAMPSHGLFSISNSTGSTGYPTETGSGIFSQRGSVRSNGDFAIWKANSGSAKLMFNRASSASNWNGWETFASEEWVTSQNYITSASIGDGTLTLATGTGLTGTASFTANQSTPSTFTVGVDSGYKLPTTTEWDSKAVIGTAGGQVRSNTDLDARYLQSQRYKAIHAVAASRTVAVTDEDCLWIVTGTRTLTVPTNASAAFPIGGRIDVQVNASGIANIEGASGVTLTHKDGTGNTSREGFTMFTFIKTGTNDWTIVGG